MRTGPIYVKSLLCQKAHDRIRVSRLRPIVLGNFRIEKMKKSGTLWDNRIG